MRRLADLAFLFQMYDFAYRTYHTAKRDFNNDHAWLHYAGALVGLENISLNFQILMVLNNQQIYSIENCKLVNLKSKIREKDKK